MDEDTDTEFGYLGVIEDIRWVNPSVVANQVGFTPAVLARADSVCNKAVVVRDDYHAIFGVDDRQLTVDTGRCACNSEARDGC